MEKEIWATIKDYPRYDISNLGRIRFLYTNATSNIKRDEPYIRALSKNGNGYYVVSLNKKTKIIHRMVLEAFVGPCPVDHEAAHLNGNKEDNRLVNLKWVTRKENYSHQRIHGTWAHGVKIKLAKLNDEKVRDILKMHADGITRHAISRKYGVSWQAIRDVTKGISWKHVDRNNLCTP